VSPPRNLPAASKLFVATTTSYRTSHLSAVPPQESTTRTQPFFPLETDLSTAPDKYWIREGKLRVNGREERAVPPRLKRRRRRERCEEAYAGDPRGAGRRRQRRRERHSAAEEAVAHTGGCPAPPGLVYRALAVAVASMGTRRQPSGPQGPGAGSSRRNQWAALNAVDLSGVVSV
jgi:hypothetical protein